MVDESTPPSSGNDPIFVVGHWRSGTTLAARTTGLRPAAHLSRYLRLFCPQPFPANAPVRWPSCFHCYCPQAANGQYAHSVELSPRGRMGDGQHGPAEPVSDDSFPESSAATSRVSRSARLPPAELVRWKARTCRGFLKCLTLREPKRIVLKTPFHTARIRTLLAMFPKARFVHVVRDPYVIFVDDAHLATVIPFRRCPSPALRRAGTGTCWIPLFACTRRSKKTSKPCRLRSFAKFATKTLVRDMVGEVRRIYDSLGLDGFEQVCAGPGLPMLPRRRATNRTAIRLRRKLRDQVTTRWRRYAEKYLYRQPSTSDDAALVGQVHG